MLVLSRKETQVIVIGDGIVVKVIAIRGQRVQLGIVAPEGIAVRRSEVQERDRYRDGFDEYA